MSVNVIGGGVATTTPAESNWPAVLGAAAGVLGMSPGAVSAQLRGGASLSDLAAQQGASGQALTGAIAGALSPSTVSATTDAEREQIATQIAQRPGGAAARYAGSDLAGELAALESAGAPSLLANAAAGYRPNGAAGTPVQSGAAVNELA
jgi:hypothetical protein